jgi:hypothetical protein
VLATDVRLQITNRNESIKNNPPFDHSQSQSQRKGKNKKKKKKKRREKKNGYLELFTRRRNATEKGGKSSHDNKPTNQQQKRQIPTRAPSPARNDRAEKMLLGNVRKQILRVRPHKSTPCNKHSLFSPFNTFFPSSASPGSVHASSAAPADAAAAAAAAGAGSTVETDLETFFFFFLW